MEPHTFLFALAIGLLLCGTIGSLVSQSGGRALGFLLGVLFGPLGILIAAVLGNRAAADARARRFAPDTSPAATFHARAPIADAPDHITVRRDGHILGTWPLADVLDYLADGRLLPGDHYLHNPAANTWRLLSRLQP